MPSSLSDIFERVVMSDIFNNDKDPIFTRVFLNLFLVLILVSPSLYSIDLTILSNEDKNASISFFSNPITEPIPILTNKYYSEGNHSGVIYWNVTDGIFIQGNASFNGTIFVQPGVTVQVMGDYEIIINGSIFAIGMKSTKIRFRPSGPNLQPGAWKGIRIDKPGFGIIQFVVITYAEVGLFLNQTDNFTILDSEVKYCSNSGIIVNSTLNISIQNNSFSYNDQYGMRLNKAKNSTIKFNTINTNNYGIYANSSDNNKITNNSLSNKIQNVNDNGNNKWNYNYYSNYNGIDKTGDNIGDTNLPFFIPGGSNNDTYPRTKIYYHDTLWGFANLAQAVVNSTALNNIMLRAVTPNAGSQSIPQEGYYYENIKIDSNLGHDVTIVGPISGSNPVILDGMEGICIDVDGNYNLTLVNVTIIKSDIGVFLHNTSSNSTLFKLYVHDCNNGIVLDNTRDLWVANCTIEQCGDAGLFGGLYIKNSMRVTVENCVFNNNLFGITLLNSTFCNVLKNNCNSNQDTGLRLNSSKYNKIYHNKLNSNDLTGMNLTSGANNNLFRNNSYQNNQNGINLHQSKDNLFVGSKIIANIRCGIYFDNHADNNTFEGIGPNSFSGSLTAAIECNRSRNIWFVNCTIKDMNIWLDKNSSIIFLNNTFSKEYVLVWDPLSNLIVMNYLSVRVLNLTGTPVKPVWVEVFDNQSILISNRTTDINGEINLIRCISYIQNQSLMDDSMNPHTIVAYDGISNKTIKINIDTKITRTIIFNYFPEISNQDIITAIEKSIYTSTYKAKINDKDKTLHWTFSTSTSNWLQFNVSNLTLFGTPQNRDVGVRWVNISVRDNDGDLAFHNFSLNITNTPPVILTKNVLTIKEDMQYYVDYNSTDDDGYLNSTGHLIFPKNNFTTWESFSNASDWLKFDNESGILHGIPKNNDVGVWVVYVLVYDGHGPKVTTFFDLRVINVPPEILGVDKVKAYKNEPYYIDYNSSDDGEGNIVWKMDTNAKWLFFNENTGVLNGTPRQSDVGEWWVNITVTDDHGGQNYRNFILEVIDDNKPPKIMTTNRLIAYTGEEYYVQYSATDEDTPLDLLIWDLSNDSAISNATWLTIDQKTGVLSGTPLKRHIGWYWVTVTVFDNAGGYDNTTFKLTVLLSPNKPPEMLTVLNEVTKKSTERWTKQFRAMDDYTPEENLRWSLRSNAHWLSIGSSTALIDIQLNQTMVGEYWVNVTVTDENNLFNYTNFTLKIVTTNNAPLLRDSGVSPKSGTVKTTFVFYVIYQDKDNDSGKVKIVIDGKTYNMKQNTSSNLQYFKGVNYTYETKLSKGVHEYYFTAVDEWDLVAKYGEDVPSLEFPAKTSNIEEIVETPYYAEPIFWIIILIIILIFFCVVLMLIKPEQFNPIVRSRITREREEVGELGYLCPFCKNVVSKDDKKCDRCGESFVIHEFICPECQAVVSGKDKFCPQCGVKFEEVELIEDEPEELEEPEVLEKEASKELQEIEPIDEETEPVKEDSKTEEETEADDIKDEYEDEEDKEDIEDEQLESEDELEGGSDEETDKEPDDESEPEEHDVSKQGEKITDTKLKKRKNKGQKKRSGKRKSKSGQKDSTEDKKEQDIKDNTTKEIKLAVPVKGEGENNKSKSPPLAKRSK